MSSRPTPPPGSTAPTAAGLSAGQLEHDLDDALAALPGANGGPPPDERPVAELLEIIHRRMLDLNAEPDSGTQPPAAAPVQPEDEDVFVLDVTYEVAPAPPEAEEDDQDVLVLDDTFASPAAPEAVADLAPEAPPEESPPVPKAEPAADPLAILLAEDLPTNDFAALDLLYSLWPRGTRGSTDDELLAVARNIARSFGLPDRLPMTAARAWQMLDSRHFEVAFSDQLAGIATFIRDWQKTHRDFLILEFSEIELVESLFEALHPGRHADLLAEIMNFKVLSNRRLGLLRRVPNRMRKAVEPLVAAGRFQEALVELAHAKALLERIADPLGFAPIIDAATRAADEIDKHMKRVAAASAPPAPPSAGGGGQALGRIG